MTSFALSSIPALLAQLTWRAQIVIVIEPPLVCSPAALSIASLSGARSWLHVQDFEVDAAFELGLIKGGHFRRLMEAIERFLMRRFDLVSSISMPMVERIKKKGVEPEQAILFPNWVDISNVAPLQQASNYRSELGLRDGVVVVQYSGNMGNKQGLEILVEVAKLLQNDERVYFVFGGNGSGRAAMEAQCSGLQNVRFLDLQPLERLNDWLGLADIHLLPQRADAADLVMPSKLTGMLASGRSVVATAHAYTELGRIVSNDANCGLVVPPEDAQAMAEAILSLVNDPVKRTVFGSNGRAYAERELDRSVILARFEARLLELVGQVKV